MTEDLLTPELPCHEYVSFPVPVPFALPVYQIAPGVLRLQESNASSLRLHWALALTFLIGILLTPASIIYAPPQYTFRLAVLLALCVFGLGLIGVRIYQLRREPLRTLDYEVATGAVRVRVRGGSSRHPEWVVYPRGAWTIRVQRVEVEHAAPGGGPGWSGFAAVVCAEPHEVPIVCSRHRDRVLAYLGAIPLDRRGIVEDQRVLRGRGVMGGELVD